MGNRLGYRQEVMPMPWKETCPMDQKIKMIGDYMSGDYTISKLARVYEVSRKTIYKWALALPDDRTFRT